MLNPDQVLFLSAAINLIAYLDILYRRKRKETTKTYQFKCMWEEYAEKHGIPLNGDDQ